MKMTREQAAAKIDAFVNGKGGKWDWDDFVAIRIQDPAVDTIRQKCVSVREEFPPTNPGDYCSSAGMDALRGILAEARSA